MKITAIDEVQYVRPPGYAADCRVGRRLIATSYRGVGLDRLVIHGLEVDTPGRGYGRVFVESLQRQYDQIHICPVEATGFWEKCGFIQEVDANDLCDLPLMTWSRKAN